MNASSNVKHFIDIQEHSWQTYTVIYLKINIHFVDAYHIAANVSDNPAPGGKRDPHHVRQPGPWRQEGPPSRTTTQPLEARGTPITYDNPAPGGKRDPHHVRQPGPWRQEGPPSRTTTRPLEARGTPITYDNPAPGGKRDPRHVRQPGPWRSDGPPSRTQSIKL